MKTARQRRERIDREILECEAMLGGGGTRLGSEAVVPDPAFVENIQAAIGPTLKGLAPQANGSHIPALFLMLRDMKSVLDPKSIFDDIPRRRMVLVSALKLRTQTVVLCTLIQNFLATRAFLSGSPEKLNAIKDSPLVVEHEASTADETPVVALLKKFVAEVVAEDLHSPLLATPVVLNENVNGKQLIKQVMDPIKLARRQILLTQSQLVGEQLGKVMVLAVQLADAQKTFA